MLSIEVLMETSFITPILMQKNAGTGSDHSEPSACGFYLLTSTGSPYFRDEVTQSQSCAPTRSRSPVCDKAW